MNNKPPYRSYCISYSSIVKLCLAFENQIRLRQRKFVKLVHHYALIEFYKASSQVGSWNSLGFAKFIRIHFSSQYFVHILFCISWTLKNLKFDWLLLISQLLVKIPAQFSNLGNIYSKRKWQCIVLYVCDVQYLVDANENKRNKNRTK